MFLTFLEKKLKQASFEQIIFFTSRNILHSVTVAGEMIRSEQGETSTLHSVFHVPISTIRMTIHISLCILKSFIYFLNTQVQILRFDIFVAVTGEKWRISKIIQSSERFRPSSQLERDFQSPALLCSHFVRRYNSISLVVRTDT